MDGESLALYHFSEEPDIAVFEPRAPAQRPDEEPLVWTVGDQRQGVYSFPRDCPRILIWPTETTTAADRERWFGRSEAEMVAHVEYGWLERMRTTHVFRYELRAETFEPLPDDPWMFVSRERVVPSAVEPVGDLFEALAGAKVELRVMESLAPLRGVWDTTVHASGIRLRNARGWD